MENIIKTEKTEIFSIFNIIKKRKFKDYKGIAVKNSIFHFATTIIGRAGSLIFMILLARTLLPELFGLYSLALSTILLFASFSDLGINQTLIRFVSKALGKENKEKAKSYTIYLLKIKLISTISVAIFLLLFSKFISDNYYHKPIFLALIAGSFYILFSSLLYFFDAIFHSLNNFKWVLFKETLFQVTRLILIPLIILIILKYSFSYEISLFLIINALTFSYFFALLFLFFIAKKRIIFIKSKKKNLSSFEKKKINKFILPLSTIILSGIFFIYIDTIMLGRFVLAEFIGYYRVSSALIESLISFIGFSVVLFPIFSRIKGKRLENALKKSVRITFILSFILIILILISAPYIILIIFGKDYQTSISLLRIFSLLLISGPLTAIYANYFIAKGKTTLVAKLLISSTIINVFLNYFLIIWLIKYGYFMAVLGAVFATLISRYLYLFGLILFKNK